MSTASGKRKVQQTQAGIRFVILIAILVCVNLLASRIHFGLDLTQEKRFTLTAPTKKMLRDMKDVAVIEVYLDGKNFPPDFQRLRSAVRERLQSFQEVAGSHIKFRFTNPFEGKSDQELVTVYQDFAARKMAALNIGQNEEERSTTQLVMPYALVQYKDKEVPILLLEGHTGMTRNEQLNYSESLLEYKFASALRQAEMPDKPRLAYVVGNGEPLDYTTYDILKTLGSLYKLDTLEINDGTTIPSVYSALIVCKPSQPFTERQKYKLDQYVMQGGRMLWMLDAMKASMDSFGNSQQFLAVDNSVNLDDQLFKYGVRINNNLLEDLQSREIYVQEMLMNGQLSNILRGWYYFPRFIPTSHHPIVNNMDAIQSKYASTMDTINTPDIRKTVLLESSQYSRTAASPVRVSLSMLRFQPKPELFNKGFQPTAVLLEGKFQSVFQDRMPADLLAVFDSLKIPFKPVADTATSMIVVSDGDIMLNEVSQSSGPQELGYSLMEKIRYANKSFVLNCLEYLTDNSGLLEARSKDVRLRLLDGGRIKRERTKWQVINIVIPIGLVLAFASCYLFFRKRRYEGR